ncbi:chalcone isomerase family protein [Aliikangiella sp. IMCC44359]|uniref:chalcone isomerase family protein n=1 Tax=Aliikangiella sp. IMCC44359 TaxID=3459125 RepID=UPI00403B1DD3
MNRVVSIVFYSVLAIGWTGVNAKELAGVDIEEVVNLSLGGQELRLKGAAVKNNARQSIYVGGLYLQNDAKSVEDILKNEGAKRFVLYCQNSTIKPDALIRALNIGFTANHNEQELAQLKPLVEKFNQVWKAEIQEGDKVWIDFLPAKGTVVTINGSEKAVIPGKLFYDAFLKTWLGDKPINRLMKKQLLGEG